MLRFFAAVATIVAVAAVGPWGVADGRDTALHVGAATPAFLVDTIDGQAMTADFNGVPAYINVFATWCPPCRREFPAILRQAAAYRGRIAFLFVDEQEPESTVKRFALQFGMGAPVGMDRGQFAATFDVRGLPESIFIDRRGLVQSIYRGTISDDVLSGELAKLAATDASVAAR